MRNLFACALMLVAVCYVSPATAQLDNLVGGALGGVIKKAVNQQGSAQTAQQELEKNYNDWADKINGYPNDEHGRSRIGMDDVDIRLYLNRTPDFAPYYQKLKTIMTEKYAAIDAEEKMHNNNANEEERLNKDAEIRHISDLQAKADIAIRNNSNSIHELGFSNTYLDSTIHLLVAGVGERDWLTLKQFIALAIDSKKYKRIARAELKNGTDGITFKIPDEMATGIFLTNNGGDLYPSYISHGDNVHAVRDSDRINASIIIMDIIGEK